MSLEVLYPKWRSEEADASALSGPTGSSRPAMLRSKSQPLLDWSAVPMIPLEFRPVRTRFGGVLQAFKIPTVRKRWPRALDRIHSEIGTVPSTDRHSLAECPTYRPSRASWRAYRESRNLVRAYGLIQRTLLGLQASFWPCRREGHPVSAIASVENRVNKWRMLG